VVSSLQVRELSEFAHQVSLIKQDELQGTPLAATRICLGNKLEVCTSAGVARTGAGGPNLGLAAQITFGYGSGSDFLGPFFSAKKKLFVLALTLCSWHSRTPETKHIDLIHSVTFAAAPQKKKCSKQHLTNLASHTTAPLLKRKNMFSERR
jgi:hypothetical protein